MARTKGGSSMRGKKRPAVTAKKPIQKAKTKIKPRAKKATKKQLPAPSTRATKAPRGPVVARGTIKATKKSTKRAPKVTPKNKKLGYVAKYIAMHLYSSFVKFAFIFTY